MLKQIQAVTLLEILSVILIIGILVALALPRFGTMKERTLDKEAKANLKLIQAAEKIYRMEAGFFYPFKGGEADNTKYTQDININLRLYLPTGENRNWEYEARGDEALDTLDTQATRYNAPSGWDRKWNYGFDAGGVEKEKVCCCPRDSECPSQDWCSSCP